MYLDDNFVFNPILWDLNMSFGSFRESDGVSLNITIPKMKVLSPLKILTSNPLSPRPLIKNLISDSTYQRMFLAHMKTILDENIRTGEYYSRAKEIQNSIQPFVLADTNKFYPYSYFSKNIDTTVGSGSNLYPGVKDLMESHMSYLDTINGFYNQPSISDINYSPEIPIKGKNILISSKINNANKVIIGIRFKTYGKFKRFLMNDNGINGDNYSGDSIFSIELPVDGYVIQYYIYAENCSSGIFSPQRAEYEFYSIQPSINKGELVINELYCSSTSTDKWLEICNTTSESICLSGFSLSDNITEPSKWLFPDTTIGGYGYLIIKSIKSQL